MNLAINGFGRIGRLALRAALKRGINVVAINDLTDTKTLAYLLKYDSVQGTLKEDVTAGEGFIQAGKLKARAFSEMDPSKLPWMEMKVDIVLDCTGKFKKSEDLKKHLDAGAKLVIMSAPPKSNDIRQFVMGVNNNSFNPKTDKIVSNASCTTNSLAPMVKVLDDAFGIERGFVTTVHGYTSSQGIVDMPNKDLRRGRAAALNLVPTSTGAATAVTEVMPHLKGKLDGMSIRVPVASGSISDFTAILKKPATVEQINAEFRKAASGYLKGVMLFNEEEIVSTDILGNTHTCIFDAKLTKANGNMAKVFGWYDNEYGYSTKLVELAEFLGGKI